MANQTPRGILDRRNADEATRQSVMKAATIIVGAVVFLLGLRLPPEMLLPAMSIFLVVSGLTLAAVLAFAGSQSSAGKLAAYRDVAAFLVFLGFAGAMLSDHGHALALLGVESGRQDIASAI